jgi:hypothetical protein
VVAESEWPGGHFEDVRHGARRLGNLRAPVDPILGGRRCARHVSGSIDSRGLG